MFALQVLTYTSEGLGRTRTIMLMTVMALPVNVLLNWVFMFGHWGAPALGAVGAGVASAITMWLALGFMILLMKRPSFARFALFAGFEWPSATRAPRDPAPRAAVHGLAGDRRLALHRRHADGERARSDRRRRVTRLP